jgi:glyoxylase-like metal-dependent hydrolase (beta-lactamase superfamily II)
MAATFEPISENIYGLVVPCGDGINVRALLVVGQRFSLLLDTLLRPSDLDGAREMVATSGRPVLVANSHADWDHWWGNVAFPDAPIFAHRLTQKRQIREGKRSLAAQRRQDPEGFADVVLRPATVAYEGTLHIDLGGLHAELSLLPGHTPDCTVAYIPERRLLFAGDVAEDPIPLVGEGPIAEWPEKLIEWAERASTVVPAHGPVSGPELLHRNAEYLQDLRRRPEAAVPELQGAPPFYKRAHRRNVRRAMSNEL